ncbi:uncharacterized protein TRUGW13939_06205 [Talaromyces rugulosus]|uniref:Tautomerase cis-CaaD-like domain-containing protein n=1 Tax=Talaromyces rugulosus TaxID=121627 RepID=A0A7H8R043_TALRU|nr:uncharacterized protein TRUGW13939_06205 [Talaromyces rugulosus]QKX59075.1 hypothetical protein TRUGW13939_06205 [Talaromyces rugulosus]
MPRWTFELAPGTISKEDKAYLAQKITALYTDNYNIPTFWVNVFFHENGEGNFCSGGITPPNAVFFHLDHAASKIETETRRQEFIQKVNANVKPIFDAKGIKWEYNIYEHPRDNWRINDMIPPMDFPEVLKEWVERINLFLTKEQAARFELFGD